MTPLALVVLRLLLERPMHPYEIQQTVQERHVDQVVKMRAGSLYHTIERLYRYGLVEPVETGRAGRRPERTVYALTESGRDEYASHLRDLVRTPQREYPVFGAAVEMMRTLGEADALCLLQQRTVALRAKLAALEQLVSGPTENGLARVDVLELDYALAITSAELDWVRRVIDDLTTGTLVWSDAPAAADHDDIEESRP